jgi:hypothetical protein
MLAIFRRASGLFLVIMTLSFKLLLLVHVQYTFLFDFLLNQISIDDVLTKVLLNIIVYLLDVLIVSSHFLKVVMPQTILIIAHFVYRLFKLFLGIIEFQRSTAIL